MKAFMDKDFLLENETARHLFHDYAEKLPLIDYHCHISPKEIYENRRFNNLVEVWLGGRNPDGTYFGDHYKWRLMRMNGVPEEYVSGNKPPYERFLKFVEALELSIGNPMVHWCNLELQTFFGFNKPLTMETARECWDFCNDKLKNDPSCTVRGIVEKTNVYYIGTTDDPIDTLEWHKKIAEDKSIRTKVYPSIRPDRAIFVHKPDYPEYIGKLAKSVGKESLDSAKEVFDALTERIEYFKSLGCRASDHGIEYVPWHPASDEEVEAVFQKAMRGEKISLDERDIYETAILMHLAKTYHRLDIAMEVHYSALRNVNTRKYKTMGLDVGIDTINQVSCIQALASFMGALDENGELPKMILFSLNPSENLLLDVLAGCFQTEEMPCKIQHGAAWWFNDTKCGMEDQMRSLASVGQLGNFIGMLTDSRSFLSYPRHNYFRRILCNMIGTLVENGEYPNREESLKRIVEGICFTNAERYFNI